MLTKTSAALCAIIAVMSQAKAENCALPWPHSVNVFDSRDQCVGTIVNVDPTVVARQIGSTIYGIQVNVQTAIPKGLATFFYPTPDCSGQAYMEDDANLPKLLWSDLNGVLWTNGTPPSAGAITVQSARQAPMGNCFAFHSDAPFLVGAATPIDNSLVNSLVPPLSVATPFGGRVARR